MRYRDENTTTCDAIARAIDRMLLFFFFERFHIFVEWNGIALLVWNFLDLFVKTQLLVHRYLFAFWFDSSYAPPAQQHSQVPARAAPPPAAVAAPAAAAPAQPSMFQQMAATAGGKQSFTRLTTIKNVVCH